MRRGVSCGCREEFIESGNGTETQIVNQRLYRDILPGVGKNTDGLFDPECIDLSLIHI